MTEMTIEEAVQTGMTIAYHAHRQPDLSAVVTQYGDRTFGELNANANKLVRRLRAAGIGDGDSVAIVSKNRPEFVETGPTRTGNTAINEPCE